MTVKMPCPVCKKLHKHSSLIMIKGTLACLRCQEEISPFSLMLHSKKMRKIINEEQKDDEKIN